MQRAFGWLVTVLLLKTPSAAELSELRALWQAVRRYMPLLIAGYLVWLSLTTVPAFFRDRPLPYYMAAIVIPQLIVLEVTSLTALAWIGYRARVKFSFACGIVLGAVIGLGSVLGLVDGVFGGGHSLRWFLETFGSIWWTIGLALVLSLMPQVILMLRTQEKMHLQRAVDAEARSERQARARAEAELRLLQGQVEPHFLYNTLANLRYLIQSGAGDALAMTDALIEYLRTSVPNIRAHHVTLGQEADHVGHYLVIMQMRMQGRLAYTIDVPESLRNVELPPLVLLTLVENAIKHGVAPRVEGGHVTLTAREHDGDVRIVIADTGAGLSNIDNAASSTGLANTRERLRLTYGTNAGLRLLANEPRGTLAELRIPKVLPRADAVEEAVALPAEGANAVQRELAQVALVDGACKTA